MTNIFKEIFRLLAFACATALCAQERDTDYPSSEELSRALGEVADLASALEAELVLLAPPIEGWSCDQDLQNSGNITGALEAIPMVFLSCQVTDRTFKVQFTLDASSADHFCRSIARRQARVRDGRIEHDGFRFFESEIWLIERSSRTLRGCSQGRLVLNVDGPRRQSDIDAGPSLMDELAQAMLEIDIGPLIASDAFVVHQQRLLPFLELLDAQSEALARIMPVPDDVVPNVPGLTSERQQNSLPLVMALALSPSASASFDSGGCRIMIEMSASEVTLREARDTGGRWAQPGGTDGAVSFAFMRRNTDRLVGQERVNGTSIEVLVDGRAIVRVLIPGSTPCVSSPDIVERHFSEIVEHSFHDFGLH